MENLIKTTPEGLRLQVTVHSPLGLHARPAARLVQEMQNFAAEVCICHGGARADAKSILDIMALAAIGGSEITLLAQGDDARQALLRAAELFNCNFKD